MNNIPKYSTGKHGNNNIYGKPVGPLHYARKLVSQYKIYVETAFLRSSPPFYKIFGAVNERNAYFSETF
jgi:hypothetical protein